MSADALWVCIQLPALPLEALAAGGDASTAPAVPVVIFEGGERQRIVVANAAATAAGIAAGDTVSAARALLPQLRVLPRRIEAERAALQALAAWAWQFCDRVCIDEGPAWQPLPPQPAILVEVASALKLHGGLDALLAQLRERFAPLGYHARIAVAPTAAAATLLARAGDGLVCRGLPALRQVLPGLPLALLRLPPDPLRELRHVGLRRIGECLALPADSLVRRFGEGTLRYLQQLTGEAAEPRAAWTPPLEYRRRFELEMETLDTEALLFPLRRLLLELAGFLRGSDRALARLRLALEHEEVQPTPLLLELATPSRDAAHLTRLLRERFERVVVPAPVRALVLTVEAFAGPAVAQHDFFDRSGASQERWDGVLDRLAARLGREALRCPAAEADHRPEHATAYRPLSAAAARFLDLEGQPLPPRPLWLLARPERLHEPPEIVSAPERVESGWWDAATAARDYFVAQSAQGARLWVYRERDAWFLHGLWA